MFYVISHEQAIYPDLENSVLHLDVVFISIFILFSVPEF